MDKPQSSTASMPLSAYNKFANRLRLGGMLLALLGGAGLIALPNPADTWLTGATVISASMMAAGFALAFAGERLWRMLLRDTSIDERQI